MSILAPEIRLRDLLLGGLLGFEFLFDLLHIDPFGYRLETLELEGLATAGGNGLVLAILAF